MPASSVFQTDDRAGNAYTIATVQHVTGTASTFDVDQSAVSVCHAAAADQSTLATEGSPSAGVSISALGAATPGSGLRRVTIASGVASGTYVIVVRHQGSAAGIGSNVGAADD